MTRLSLSQRWLEGALFLSLDMVTPLFEDLWVPVDDPLRFQNKLRTLLDGLFVDESYHLSNRAALEYRVMEWFHGTPELSPELLSSWIRNILVLEGPDRPGETRWTSLSFRIPQRNESERGPRERLVHEMTAVASFERERRAPLESKLEIAGDQDLGEWDARILEFQDSSQDVIVTKAALITEYNIFLAGWERHCAELDYSALYQLWLLGREAAPAMGMKEADIAFPGSWRFELLPFLRKFAS